MWSFSLAKAAWNQGFQSIPYVWSVPKLTASPCHCCQLNSPALLGSLLLNYLCSLISVFALVPFSGCETTGFKVETSSGNGTLWKSHGMGYDSSALLVGSAAQVGKGPLKARVFVGSSCGAQTSVCWYRRAEMPPLVQRHGCTKCVRTLHSFSAIASFAWAPAWV